MKFENKIRKSKLAYLFFPKPVTAFEIAFMNFGLALNKHEPGEANSYCQESIYWLEKAGVSIPEKIKQLELNPRLHEIQKILVANKELI